MKLLELSRSVLLAAGLAAMFGVLATAAENDLPETVPEVKADDASSSLTAEQAIDIFLADPTARDPRFKPLGERRAWLAMQDGSLDHFEKVATEFEALGAHYSALEILFFAEKIATEPETRQALNTRMLAVIAKTRPAEDSVAEADQLWDADRRKTAMDTLNALSKEYPYCEKVHHRIGEYYLTQYMEDTGKENVGDMDTRVQLFRLCYERFMVALALDPILYDTHYQLNILRSVLPDVPEFLKKTEPFSTRAMTFLTEVIPALSALEEGDRSPEALAAAGEAFEEVGNWPYAIFVYQAAVSQAGENAAMVEDLTGRIERIRKEHLTKKKA